MKSWGDPPSAPREISNIVLKSPPHKKLVLAVIYNESSTLVKSLTLTGPRCFVPTPIISAKTRNCSTFPGVHFCLFYCLHHFANPIEYNEILFILLRLSQRCAYIIESNISSLHGHGFRKVCKHIWHSLSIHIRAIINILSFWSAVIGCVLPVSCVLRSAWVMLHDHMLARGKKFSVFWA